MLKKSIGIILVIICSITQAAKLEKQGTKSQMQDILKTYIKIVPYVYSNKNMSDEHFMTYMNDFEQKLKNSNHFEFFKQENFDPNLSIIRSSIHQFKESAKMKNFYFAKRGLKTIVAKCITCHAQLPSEKYGKINGKYVNILEAEVKSSYDQAMMAYLLRDYKMAINKFMNAVKEYKHDPQIQDRSIRKIIKISFMNTHDKNSLLKDLKAIKPYIKKGTYLSENIEMWEKQILEFKLPASGIGIKKLVKQMLVPIEDEVRLGDPSNEMIKLHYMQGVLSRYMTIEKGKGSTAMALYWLGLIENSFHEDFMFSLGDMYLKRCIKDYSSSEYAMKCYKALEDSYVMGFTGSSGTSIPSDIKKELKNLKKLLKNKKGK